MADAPQAEEVAEVVSEEFKCPICGKLFYEPHVLQCGHVFCWECIYGGMDAEYHFLHCPYCQVCSTHFVAGFEMLQDITEILYPRTSVEVAAEHGKVFEPLTTDLTEPQRLEQVRAVLVCESCRQFLKRPVVKPCGHVFCDGCVTILDDGSSICFVCKRPNWLGKSGVCSSLKNFIENELPEPPAIEEEQTWWEENGITLLQMNICFHCFADPIVGDCYACERCEKGCACCVRCHDLNPVPDQNLFPGEHEHRLYPPVSVRNRILSSAAIYPEEKRDNVLKGFRRKSVVYSLNENVYCYSFEGLRRRFRGECAGTN